MLLFPFSCSIALPVVFSHGEVSRSAAISSNFCLTDWLDDAGIHASKSGRNEVNLREANVQIDSVRHFSPMVL